VKKTTGRRDMRRHVRQRADLAVIVRAADSKIERGLRLDTADLSEGGAFLRGEFLFEIGAALELEISLPAGTVVKTPGRVVRVARSPEPGATVGMGIEFTGLSLPDRRAIASTLTNLGPANPTTPSPP